MDPRLLSFSGIKAIFDIAVSRPTFYAWEDSAVIPASQRGKQEYRYWKIEDLPAIGAFVDAFKKPSRTISIAIYVSKGGGAHKTTFAYNLAKFLAMHGIKILLIPLDFQQSMSKKFGFRDDYDSDDTRGYYDLYDVAIGKIKIEKAIVETDFPNIDIIPESISLTTLETYIQSVSFREQTILNLVKNIKHKYDLIIYDNDSSWDNLAINSIVASDIVIAPIGVDSHTIKIIPLFLKTLEKKLNNHPIDDIIFVPGMTENTTIKRGILDTLKSKFSQFVTVNDIRKASIVDEANFSNMSVFEYAPKSTVAEDYKRVCKEIWDRVVNKYPEKNQSTH